MMKGFTLFRCEKPDFENVDFEELKSREPEHWYNVGIVPHYALYDDEKDQYVYNDCIQVVITERLLPSSAINRHLKLKADAFVAETGQKVTRQQKAEWKEAYIDEHLPNAPLRETTVFVAWHDGYMFVGSPSQKTVERIGTFILMGFNPTGVKLVQPKDVNAWFIEQFKNQTDATPFDKAKIVRIDTNEKVAYSNSGDLDVAKELIENFNCRIKELGFITDTEDVFTLTEKGFVKGLKVNNPDVENDDVDKIVMYRADELLQREARKRIAQLIEKIGVSDEYDI